MGNTSELPGDLDCIFSLVRAEKVGGMADAGGSEPGSIPSRTSNSLWTLLGPNPNDGRDVTVRLWCNLNGQIASSEMGGGLGLGCKGRGFHGGGSWFERVVCTCFPHVEPFDMSHDHSRSLWCKSWDNAGQGDGHSTLDRVGNKTVPMLSLQCGKCILTNTSCDHVMGTSTERWDAWLSCETWIVQFR